MSTYLSKDPDVLPHGESNHVGKQHIKQAGAAPRLGPHVVQEDGVAGE